MKNRDLVTLYNGLQGCGHLTGVKFSYAIAKNIKKLNPTMEVIQEEVKKLQLDNAKIDKDNKPIIKESNYQMKDPIKFEEEYKKLMDIDTPVELFKLKKSELPENITAGSMASISDIIEDF